MFKEKAEEVVRLGFGATLEQQRRNVQYALDDAYQKGRTEGFKEGAVASADAIVGRVVS